MNARHTSRSLTAWMIFALMLPILGACSPQHEAPSTFTRASKSEARAVKVEVRGEADHAAVKATHPTSNMGAGESTAQARMIIREATLRLRADTPGALVAKATRLAEGAGGFIVNSQADGVGADITRIDMTLRVPADDFEATLARLRGLGVVLSEQASGQDVTEEYVDLNARLRAKRQLEARFLDILAGSTSVEDTLRVEQELARVRADIEQMTGRARYLERRTSMSTIHLSATTPHRPDPPQEESIISIISGAFNDGARLFVQVCAGVIRVSMALLPIGMVFGGLGIFVILFIRLFRRRS